MKRFSRIILYGGNPVFKFIKNILYIKQKEYVYALSATFFWSTMASTFKLTLPVLEYNILQMLLFSSLVSVVGLFLYLLFTQNLKLLKGTTLKDIRSSSIMGLLNPCIYYLILFEAYSLLPGQEAGTLNYTWPIALTLLSIPFLKQKIKLVHIVAILLGFIGVLIISTQGRVFSLTFTNFNGAMLAVGSSFIWALYWIFNMRDKRDARIKLFLNFCIGTVFLFIIAIISGNLQFPPFYGIIGIIWVGLFEMGFTYLFWLKALELAPRTSIVSNLVYLSPFLSLFFLQTVVKENILLSSLVGLVLIIAGILLQSRE